MLCDSTLIRPVEPGPRELVVISRVDAQHAPVWLVTHGTRTPSLAVACAQTHPFHTQSPFPGTPETPPHA